MRYSLLVSKNTSPYENLAIEKYLTEHIGKDEVCLFLWRNDDTIVIGRNQNVWQECRVSEFLESGGRIARRLSGGGAVYHDGGNLNFSFIYSGESWSTERGLSVIADACRDFGINAAASGRNDILADGAKFSGNAFFSLAGGVCHHGCILIATDTDRLSRFLTVSKDKLESKGIRSVKSRVVNLSSLSPSINAERLSESLVASFERSVGERPQAITLSEDSLAKIKEDAYLLSSDEWIFGKKIDFTHSFGARYTWGGITLDFKVSAGIVAECKVYSDSLSASLAEALEVAFVGKAFSARELKAAIPDGTAEAGDIAALLNENI